MVTLQLAITGRLVGPTGTSRRTILVSEGRIIDFVRPSSNVQADVKLDYGDKFLLPGLIDTHVHLRDPGFTHKEDFATGTLAAAAGGVTTVVDMPNTDPWVDTGRIFRRKLRRVMTKASVDFGLSGCVSQSRRPFVEELTRAGALSIEAFLADAPDERILDDNSSIYRVLEDCARAGQVFGVYCEDQSLWRSFATSNKTKRGDGMAAFHRAKPPVSEALGVSRVCVLNQDVRANLLLRQISTSDALRLARFFRRNNSRIHVETTPHHLLLTERDERGQNYLLKISPPLRHRSDRIALWRGINDGTINVISSDHSPHSLEEKERHSVWESPGGFPGVETSLVLMLDQVRRGRMELKRLAQLMSENPARIFGLYPKKGALVRGAQADIIVVDFSEQKVEARRLHSKCGWTPYEGRRVRGTLWCTILAGNVIYRDSEILLRNKGSFVSRARAKGG